MDNQNLKMQSAYILPPDGGPQRPLQGPVTRSVAAGKPRPQRGSLNPKRHRPRARRPDCFSEKYRRLMETMGGKDGGAVSGGEQDQGAHGGPQHSPRHPDSYSVKFRTLMEVMGRSEEKRAGPDGGSVAVATPEAGGAKEERSGSERGSSGGGRLEKSRSEGPAPPQNEEEEEEEEDEDEEHNSAELDWMAAMVEALIDGELHQSQVQEPEATCLTAPTAQPVPVPGPLETERRSPSSWGRIGMTSDLEAFIEDVLTGQQLPIPPFSHGQNLDMGPDPLVDLSHWPFLTSADLFLPKPSEPNTQPGQAPIAPPSEPANEVGHLGN